MNNLIDSNSSHQEKNKKYTLSQFLRNGTMPVRKYFTFKGRASREEMFSYFGLIFLTIMLLGIARVAVVEVYEPVAIFIGIVEIIVILGSFIPTFTVQVRRMHDQDKSWWWTLIPFFNLYLFFAPGTKNENRFGNAIV